MKLKLYLLLIFLVGLINFLPVLGFFSATQLSLAYGVELNSNDLEILMRHRALLFGILGGFVFYSLFKPNLRLPALVMTAVSKLGFIYLAWSVGDINEALIKVTQADLVGLLCLIMALLMGYLLRNDGP